MKKILSLKLVQLEGSLFIGCIKTAVLYMKQQVM